MKKIKIAYWIFTILLALFMGPGALYGLINPVQSVDLIVHHLGYPAYFVPFTGVAKVIGTIVLFIPGFPRLKEWVYAGFTFDLLAAIYSFISVGDPVKNWMPLILGLVFIAGSYIFYHKLKKYKEVSLLKDHYAVDTAFVKG